MMFSGDKMVRLEATGTVVGLLSDRRYDFSSLELGREHRLVAFSDGVTEPVNSGDEEFGASRLTEVLLQQAESPPKLTVEKVMEAVVNWAGTAEFPDDMTVLVARWSSSLASRIPPSFDEMTTP